MRRSLVIWLVALLGALPGPAVPAAAAAEATIGVVGCSNTHDAVAGYHQLSPEHRLWDFGELSGQEGGPQRPYAGAEITAWAREGSNGWRTFDDYLADHPGTDTVWWELCVGDGTTATNATAEAVAALIRTRLPGAAIYASPLDDTPSCGKGDAPLSEQFVEHLVAEGLVLRGPTMTPLASDETNDGCHGNEQGDLVWGQDLVDFFDGDGPPAGGAPGTPAGDGFVDVSPTNTFFNDIEWLTAQRITRGCNPPTNDRFCPTDPVTRGQMAAFLNRALGLPASPVDAFSDDNGTTFEADINALAAAGITTGCTPSQYCPEDLVTRGQMASFLVRAYRLTAGAGNDLFVDDDDTTHEPNINVLRTAKVTLGCNPPANDRYCPSESVTRQQMAAFLHRAALLP